MRVTVEAPVFIPPPSPGWWQTPYLFLILPGIFLGVAMFAQRQRWRPAKAFLVDERGKMLREFPLDPSCQVTYDQAVQAGVLDAFEKTIKVTKYDGQTVRGDALAVVLLAYGPVTVEQVEFAREMLVQVQDKFEDAVKQRLEEARLRETELAAQTKDLEERRVGVEARTGELDAVQPQMDEQRTRIGSAQAAIDAKEEGLKRREVQVAENRKVIDDLARELETLRTDLDTRTGQVLAGETELTEKSSAIRERETAVGTNEAQLNEREQGIATEEARLNSERERLVAEANGIQVQAQGLETREAAVRKELEDLAGGRAQFEIDQKDLLEFKRSVDARVANAEQAEAAAAAKTEDLTAREGRLAPVEAELAAREAHIHEAEEVARQERTRAEAILQEVSDRTRDLGNRDRKNGKGPEGTRGADRRIGNPGAGSRRQGGPVPGDGGHTRGGAPNLADDSRIPTGAAQGAAGNVRTRERLAAGSLGGPRDAPRAARDRTQGSGGKGPSGCRVGRAKRGRSHTPREGGPRGLPIRLGVEGGNGPPEGRSRAASPRNRFERARLAGRNRTPRHGTREADGRLERP